MKLKEKLAATIAKCILETPPLINSEEWRLAQAALIGFEKAREMAFNKTEELQISYQLLRNSTCAEIGCRILELGNDR